MAHYFCPGTCETVSDQPGTCQAEGCSHHLQPLQECNCDDAEHLDWLAKPETPTNPTPLT